MTEPGQDAMAAITAAIQQRNAPKNSTGLAGTLAYPYQSVPPGTTLVVRMTPAKGGSAVELPWADLYVHKLRFDGTINSDHDNDDEAVVIFTAAATWGLTDPINGDIKPLWDTDRELARQYYHSRTTLIPVMVVSSPVVEKIEAPPKGRALKSGPQLTKALESALLNAGFDHPPWSWQQGRDTIIPVTNQGGFRNYATACYRGKVRPVPVEERLTNDELPDLAAIIGQPPNDELVRLQWELYEASRAGLPFDNARFGKHFRAYSNSRPTNGHAAPGAVPKISDEHHRAAADQLAALRAKNTSTISPLTS